MSWRSWNDSPGIVAYWAFLVAVNGLMCAGKVRAHEVEGLTDDLTFLALFAFALGWSLRGWLERKAGQHGQG